MIDQLEAIRKTAAIVMTTPSVMVGRAAIRLCEFLSMGSCRDIRIFDHISRHGDADRDVTAKKLIQVCCELSIYVHRGSPFIW